MAELTGKFGGIWISDDRAELAVEVIGANGSTDTVIMQMWPDESGYLQPTVTEVCVQPEVLERGWTYIPTGRP